jgi:hypothetical protein
MLRSFTAKNWPAWGVDEQEKGGGMRERGNVVRAERR